MFLDRAVGIDLGTTNSEIAWLPPSERDLVIYADRFGRRTVPSAVAWDEKESAFVVGHAARSKRGTAASPDRVHQAQDGPEGDGQGRPARADARAGVVEDPRSSSASA